MTAPTLDQIEMKTVRLRCPVAVEDLQALRLGDLVFLDGPIFTGREGVYQRFLAEGILAACGSESASSMQLSGEKRAMSYAVAVPCLPAPTTP